MLRALASLLARIDRRFIFALVAVAVIWPLLRPLGLPVKPSPNAVAVHDLIEKLQPGDTVLMSFDYDPASSPELNPMARAMVRHCFRKDVKIIACALWAQGPPLANQVFDAWRVDTREIHAGDAPAPAYREKVYGVDFLNVGTHPNWYGALQGMGKNFHDVWRVGMEYKYERDGETVTVPSKPLSEYPISRGVRTYADLKLIISFTTGDVGITKYIQVAHTQFKAVVTGGCTAVTSLELYPFLASGQLSGLLEGMKGGADYEVLSDYPRKLRKASEAMEPQSVVHLLVIAFILIANFVHYVEKHHGLKG